MFSASWDFPGYIPQHRCAFWLFDMVLNTVLPVRSRIVIRRVSRNAGFVKTHRLKVIRHLLKVNAILEPHRVTLDNSLPEESPARSLNIPLITLMAQIMERPDRRPPEALVRGVEIVGGIPSPNALTTRKVAPSTDGRVAKQGLRPRNKIIIRSISKTQDELQTNKCWETSALERQKGRLAEIAPASNFDRQNMILSPIFCISGKHGTQWPKFRLVDGLSRSLANAAVAADDAYRPHDLDTSVVLARLLNTYGDTSLRIHRSDFLTPTKPVVWTRRRGMHLTFASLTLLTTGLIKRR